MLNGRTYVISAFIDAISIIIHVRNYYLTHIYNIFFSWILYKRIHSSTIFAINCFNTDKKKTNSAITISSIKYLYKQ